VAFAGVAPEVSQVGERGEKGKNGKKNDSSSSSVKNSMPKQIVLVDDTVSL
jgi:hypothetical protein